MPDAAAADAGDHADEADSWSFSAELYTYFLPGEDDIASPRMSASLESWHVEARYNYEAVRSASLWSGPRLSVGDDVVFELGVMFGGVFGEVRGFAPGFIASLSWWKLELYSEGEYLFDAAGKSDWYYYSWSELTIAPLEWLWLGIVGDRTRVYRTELELQRGFLLGVQYEELYAIAHVLNPALDPIVVLALGAEW